MKKIFTLAMMALLTTAVVSAQSYRKWDFTKWSDKTIANLKAEAAQGGVTGGAWSDTEKADGSNPQPDKCYWSYSEANVGSDGLMANGALISETEGLVFNGAYVSRRSLAIAVDYPSTSLGDYGGPQYLWLGGGNAKSPGARLWCFYIPKVQVGQKIVISAESHKPSDARGVSLFVNKVTDDALQVGESFTPKTLATNTWENWTLPEGATTNDDGTVDIYIYNTNGCHIYSIEVGDPNQKSKIAYLYGGTTDEALTVAKANENYQVEEIDVTTATVTSEQLQGYDVTIVASTVSNDAAVAAIKEAQPWTPVVNLNPDLYAAWGYGEATNTGMNIIEPVDKNHKLFNGVEPSEQDDVIFVKMNSQSVIQGVKLSGKFADDEVVATAVQNPDVVTIHTHNIGHNGYVYVPFNGSDATDDAKTILGNAIKVAAQSKAEVTAAKKPTITLTYKNMATEVTISSSVPSPEIFYTVNGSDPTEENVYTGPFVVSEEGVTVKAVVRGDGYLMSEVASLAVDLKQQAAAPTISVAQAGCTAIATLACATEGVHIFYNYEASTDTTKSTLYTEPIELMTNKTLTAIAGNSVYVLSEPTTQTITVENPLVFTEVLGHMDANKADYYQKFYDMEEKPNGDSSTKVVYFFSWGKTKEKYPYYDTSADPISTTTDPETGDEVNVYPMNPEEKYDFGNGWAVRSRGQIIVEEIAIKAGTDVGNTTSYNPATVDEFEFAEQYPVTECYLNLSEWNTAKDPRSAMIYSTKKFKGPFVVLAYISNGNSGTGPEVVFETGDDIEGDAVETEWNQIGEACNLTQGQRLYKKFVRVYSGEDEVYLRARHSGGGSKAGFYDIYVLGLDPDSITGISELANGKQNTQSAPAVYNLSGIRQNGLKSGLNIVVMGDGTVKKVMVK